MSNQARDDGWRSFDSSDQPSPPGDAPPAEAPSTATPEGEISGVRDTPHQETEIVAPDGGTTQKVDVPMLFRALRNYDECAASGASATPSREPPGTRPSTQPPRAPSERPMADRSSAVDSAPSTAADPLAPPGPPLDDRGMGTPEGVTSADQRPPEPTGSTIPADAPHRGGDGHPPMAAGIPGASPTTQPRDTLEGMGGASRPHSTRGPSQPPLEATGSTVPAGEPRHEGSDHLPSAAGIPGTPPPPQHHDMLEGTGSAPRPRSPRRVFALSLVLLLVSLLIGGVAAGANYVINNWWLINPF